MSKSEIIRFLILRSIGNFLLLFAIFGVVATFGPTLYYEARFRIIQARGVTYKVEDPAVDTGVIVSGEGLRKVLQRQNETQVPVGFAELLRGPKEHVLIPKDTQFSILIPKIGASSKVFPNVDASNEKEFLPVLQEGVAHAKGTVFPGNLGNIYLFAHSTDNFWDVGRYNAVFYLLKDLSKGDDIIVFFQDKRHNYVVTDSIIADPKDVSYIVNSQQTGEEKLILQTCWPPGTTWKRLIVIARPK
ncbi:MAG: sortase [Patescibacteria group bacterium]|nr:sortase [Patescibacteria group bacterium]